MLLSGPLKRRWRRRENDDEGFAGIYFAANAFAQDATPKVDGKPLVQVKPKEPAGCRLVGTVKGTKLWAGDCMGPELRGAQPATEPKQ